MESSGGQSANEDTKEYAHWQIYAGKSLTDASVEPVHILIDVDTIECLESCSHRAWRTVLRVVEIDIGGSLA